MNPNMYMQLLKRNATAWGVLDYCALIGVLFGWLFWSVIYIELYHPTAPLQYVVTIVGAGLHAFAQPTLWSALLPTTAAGQLLQKTRWRTVGFVAIITFALFLLYISWTIIYAWQGTQPNVVANGLQGHLTIVWLILTVGVPALAFVQVTPAEWLKQVEQWQQVQRLNLQFKSELLLAREAYGRAITILRLGLDGATLQQRQYVAGVWAGLHKAEQYNLRAIAMTLDDNGLAASVIDPEAGDIGNGISTIAKAIEATADHSDTFLAPRIARYVARERGDDAPPSTPSDGDNWQAPAVDRIRTPAPENGERGGDGARNVAPPRPAAPRRAPPRYAAEYDQAVKSFTGMFSAAELGNAFGKSERTARDWLKAWEDDGLVGRGESKAGFYFTESEAA